MYKAIVNEKQFEVELNDGENSGTINGTPFELDVLSVTKKSYHILENEKSHLVEVLEVNSEEKSVELKIDGQIYQVKLKDKYDELLTSLGMENLTSKKVKDIKAPMPGLVIDVMVKPGDVIQEKDPILILEAMKMENVLKSPVEGVIKTVKVEKSNTVEKNEILIEFE